MKKINLMFFAVTLFLGFILFDSKITSLASEQTEEEYFESDNWVRGVSSGDSLDFDSYNCYPGISSKDSSENVYLKPNSASKSVNIGTKPLLAPFNFDDTLTGYVQSNFLYKFSVNGSITKEGSNNVFNNVNWTPWTMSGQNYFNTLYFINTINNRSSASTGAVGTLVDAYGNALTVTRTLNLTIYANNYSG